MKTQIIETADRIREILDAGESLDAQKLIDQLDIEPELVYYALGWLARGNEIVCSIIDSRIVVSSATTCHEFLW